MIESRVQFTEHLFRVSRDTFFELGRAWFLISTGRQIAQTEEFFNFPQRLQANVMTIL
jgi:hypothetical protein